MNTCNTGAYTRLSVSCALLVFLLLLPVTGLPANPPAKPETIEPNEGNDSNQPTYRWNAVPGATWYRLWVNDANVKQEDASKENKATIVQWYTAAQVGCANGTVICSIKPEKLLAPGNATWWVLAWNDTHESGPWSNPRNFPVPASAGPVPLAPRTNDRIDAEQPTYSWQTVSNATWYQVQVESVSAEPKIEIMQWYSAKNSNHCQQDKCEVTPNLPVATPFDNDNSTPILNQARWKVRDWSSNGPGSWSTPQNFTIDIAKPSRPETIKQPSGTINTNRPTYRWEAVPGATWYRLWVNDADNSPVIDEWYTAVELDCPGGTGTCSVTPTDTLVEGAAQWWLKAWNSQGDRGWSAPYAFTVDAGCGPTASNVVEKNTPLALSRFNRELIRPTPTTIHAFKVEIPNQGVEIAEFVVTATSATALSANHLVSMTSCPGDETRINLKAGAPQGACWRQGAEVSTLRFTSNQNADKRTRCVVQPGQTYYFNVSNSVLDPIMFWMPPENGELILTGNKNCTTTNNCSFYAEGSPLN